MNVYAQPQALFALPWGEGHSQLPYGRTDLGGIEDDCPTDLAVAGDGLLWLRYGQSGSVWMLEPVRRGAAGLDLQALLPEAWRGGPSYGFAMGRDPTGGMALIAGARAAGELRFSYRLLLLDPRGRPRGDRSLDSAYFDADVPERLAVDAGGRFWVQAGKTLWIIGADGEPVEQRADTGGLLLDSGRFLADGEAEGEPMRLLDAAGSLVSELPRPSQAVGGRMLAAGPSGLVLIEQSSAGNDDPVEIGYLIASVDPRGTALAIRHHFLLPALRLRPDAHGDLSDGSPILSWFPPGCMAFADNGDLLLVRITLKEFLLARIAAGG